MDETVETQKLKPIELNHGETFCKSCGGFGLENGVLMSSGFESRHSPCKRCGGSGKTDWLEEILIRFNSNNIH